MAAPSSSSLADDAIHVWHVPWLRRNTVHGALPILAAALGVAAAELVLEVGEHGKPTLAAPFTHVGFSWSHSGNEALLAVGVGLAEVGVDLERRRPRPRALELARRFFADDETDALEAMPDDLRQKTFLSVWTAKEAVLKAHGGGIVYGLHRVAFDLSGAPRPKRFDGAIGPVTRWHVRPLAVGGDFHAHLAWSGPERRIIFMNGLEPLPDVPV